ncbi:putative nucleotide-diphospho-sugar transferase [Natronorubrum bangense]|uniref:putative nucleotide-diphospho-sugar transferase n=1 Tax=Natronorubrum bangense TaxID=61858 RepID=UPI001267BC5A|nr:putative nucleotide-diphospho-sugar transferase [Natronorubrum bangense]
MEKTEGIVYIATGEEFRKEARYSAKIFKRSNTNTNTCIISESISDQDKAMFDDWIEIESPNYSFQDNIKYIKNSPYEKTIYLDTDIYVDSNISDLFMLLDSYDLAATHNHHRAKEKVFTNIPKCFPEYNTGVLAYKSNEEIDKFFNEWGDNYSEDHPGNQQSFRKTLYESTINYSTLPPEYNLMIRYPGHAVGKVKVFHSRLIDIDSPGAPKTVDVERAARKINQHEDHRVFFQKYTNNRELRIYTKKPEKEPQKTIVSSINLMRRAISSVRKNGVKSTLVKAKDRL